jgi:hypothetical protein
MPTFRRLSAEEMALLRAKNISVDLTEYRDFLGTLAPGEGGEVQLGPEDQRRTVKRRLTSAAKQLNQWIRYRRGENGLSDSSFSGEPTNKD